jgi:alkanesulfonate monooxygenase SsuD/methylene tetrahydromethanopterin reductase-like flavin-dependent oxidoreductase (luciferase family)
MRFGLHAGPQDCTLDDLRRLWAVADEHFEWCSVWDHLYSVSDLADPAKPAFEGVSIMAALGAATRRVEVGCLVFCAGYRNPGVLAKAAVTIDHVSGGRCVLGIGAGWNQNEFDAFGMPFKSIGARLDHLEETAEVLRRLFDGETVTLHGHEVQVEEAICCPRPVQPRLPIWIGGAGEKRMLRIVATWADGWNVPFVAPEAYAAKSTVLDQWCERVGRDPAAVRRTVNLGLAIGETEARVRLQEEKLQLMFGALTDYVKPGHLVGTPAVVRERLGAYRDAGAEQVNLALRAPFDWEGLDLFVREVLPAVR